MQALPLRGQLRFNPKVRLDPSQVEYFSAHPDKVMTMLRDGRFQTGLPIPMPKPGASFLGRIPYRPPPRAHELPRMPRAPERPMLRRLPKQPLTWRR